MKIKTIFLNGKVMDEERDLGDLIKILQEFRRKAHEKPVAEYLEFFDRVGARWRKNRNLEKTIGAHLGQLADFLKKENLGEMVDVALRGDRGFLDSFRSMGSRSLLYHAQPRGLVAQWLAGNVPMLGIYSIVQALITKNVTMVRASSRAYRELIALLADMSEESQKNESDKDILNGLAVVLVEKEDHEAQEAMSLAADARIAWGGQEAVDAILNLKKRFFVEDIIYGPKYSYTILDKDSLSGGAADLAVRTAIDVSVFDQYACSSPHTIFVERGGKVNPREFAGLLAKELERVSRTILPKAPEAPAEASKILTVRAENIAKGEVLVSAGLTWTVIYSEEKGLADSCFSRVIFVRPVDSLDDLDGMNDRRKQTVGLALSGEEKFRFADRTSLFGVDRFPKIGEMSHFDSPWDGLFGIDRLVRWVSCHK